MIHLDTHVLVWVLGGHDERLPPKVRQVLERETLVFSPLVRLELAYLHEIGRLNRSADEVLSALRPALELTEASTPLVDIVTAAEALSWTRDPFDRLIAGTAVAAGAPLLTADRTMLEHLPQARWGA